MISFCSFVKESEDTTNLEKYLDTLGVDHSLTHKAKSITIHKIVVPKNKRNEGVGTKAIKAIVSHANEHNKRIELTPSSDFGGAKGRLVNFYKRHGFVENKGKNKDFSTRETMYKEPNR